MQPHVIWFSIRNYSHIQTNKELSGNVTLFLLLIKNAEGVSNCFSVKGVTLFCWYRNRSRTVLLVTVLQTECCPDSCFINWVTLTCDAEGRPVSSRHVFMPWPAHNIVVPQRPHTIFIFIILHCSNRFGSFLALRVYHMGCAALQCSSWLPTFRRKLRRVSSENFAIDWQGVCVSKIEPPYPSPGHKRCLSFLLKMETTTLLYNLVTLYQNARS